MRYLVGILALSLLLAACGGKKPAAMPQGMEFGRGGNHTVVKRGNIMVRLEESGEIQPAKSVDVKSLVSGTVSKFYVEEGDYVKQGMLIADIEPDFRQADDISQKKDNLDKSLIDLNRIRKEYQDNLKLWQQRLISQDDLDRSRDNLRQGEINHEASRMQYKRIRDIEIDSLRNVSRLYSTASGTVIERKVEPGEMVASSNSSYSDGTVVLVLADLDTLIVTADINEVDISKIKQGQKVDISVEAYPYTTYKGHITKIAIKAETKNNIKVFPIEITLDTHDDKLRPGMTAKVTVLGENRENILVLPLRAIFANQDNEDVVYKMVGDSIAPATIVRTGINNFMEVEIIEGVAEGDTISLREPAMFAPTGP